MLILYGNIFKVTRNRMPADVRFRRSARLGQESRPAELSQANTGTPLIRTVKLQSATATKLATNRVQCQTINSENSSPASSDRRQIDDDDDMSRQGSGRNSECFEMVPIEQERRPDVDCTQSARGSPTTTALKSLGGLRFNSSAESRSTSAPRASLSVNWRCSGSKDEWRRTAGATAGERAAHRENKAAKTLAIVVGGFVICWLPFFVLYVVEPFCLSCRVSDAVRSALTWLGYANSLVNPFIYATYNKHFRYSFWHLTVGRFHACLSTRYTPNDFTATGAHSL